MRGIGFIRFNIVFSFKNKEAAAHQNMSSGFCFQFF